MLTRHVYVTTALTSIFKAEYKITTVLLYPCSCDSNEQYQMILNSGVGRCQKVGGGGGGGAHRHVIYLPSVKNQYKRAVFGYMVIYEQPSVSVY